MKKLLKWGITLTISLSVIIIVSFILFIETGANRYVEDEKMNNVIEEIKSSPKLSNNFLIFYERAYPKSLENGFWSYAFKYLIGKKHIECPCRRLGSFIRYDIKSTDRFGVFLPTMLAVELEDHVTQTECLSYLLNQYNYPYNVKGIKQASLYFLDKNIEELDEEELSELVIMIKNPFLYNRKRNPERVKKSVKELLDRLN